MTVRAKILGGLASVFVIGLLLGIVGLMSVSRLADMAHEQNDIQTAGNGVTSVLNAHYTWRQTLTEATLAMAPFTGSLDPTTCALGKWKDSDDAKKITDTEILNLLKSLDEPHNYIHNEAKNVVALIEAGDREGAANKLINDILPRTKDAISILEAMEARYNVLLEAKGLEIAGFGGIMNTVMVIIIVAAFCVFLFMGWKITASIMKPIRKIAKGARTIATGDLEVDIHYPVKDEIGQLSSAFQEMLDSTMTQVAAAERIAAGDLSIVVTPRSEKDAMNIAFQSMLRNLNRMFSDIQTSTGQVSAGSRQIADGAQTLAQGATQQAAAVEELSSSIVEIESKTKANADMAEQAARLSGTIKDGAEKGSRQMGEMMEAVKDINQAGQSIGKVIKVIDDIAFQTNILALNAAVEAARAGQHGKGFAVVAEEVRNLAAKSAEAAKDTSGLIANSIEKAELGAKIASDTAESLTEIVSGINESSSLVEQIAQSSEEQSLGISQINKGIEQVAQVVQQNSAAAEESAAASEQMSGQADILESLISQFKLSDSVGRGYKPPAITSGGVSGKASGDAGGGVPVEFGKY